MIQVAAQNKEINGRETWASGALKLQQNTVFAV